MNKVLVYDGLSAVIGVALWISGVSFVLPLQRKKRFALRLTIGLLGFMLIAVFMERLDYSSWWTVVYMGVYYLCVVLFLHCCAYLHGFELWYLGVWVLLSHQFCWGSWGYVLDRICTWQSGRTIVIWIILSGASYLAVALTVARWMPEKGHYQVGPRQTISAFLLCIVFEVLFLQIYRDDQSWAVNLMAQFYCLTILYLQSALFKKSRYQQEIDTLQALWHQQKEQFQISKETIDLINQKCHDLKHQMQAMRTICDESEREKVMEEIGDSIEIYSAIVKTGNEILDVILTEKGLLCEKYDIHISCVADGTLLSFMNPVDLYTMFGNALDNAMASVKNMQEKEKRVIDLMIFARQKLLLIQIINPVEEELKFDDGLPITTKENKGYHGFGLKSIRHTVSKYGGHITVEVKEGCFYLTVMIPLPEMSSATGETAR